MSLQYYFLYLFLFILLGSCLFSRSDMSYVFLLESLFFSFLILLLLFRITADKYFFIIVSLFVYYSCYWFFFFLSTIFLISRILIDLVLCFFLKIPFCCFDFLWKTSFLLVLFVFFKYFASHFHLLSLFNVLCLLHV